MADAGPASCWASRWTDDLVDAATGELTPIFLVTDNGPCFESATVACYVNARPSYATSAPVAALRRPTA